MQASKEVVMRLKDTVELDLSELHELQGDLKSLEKSEFEKLKASILKEGFIHSPHVYFDKPSSKWFLCDGHQRSFVLKALKAEGYIMPKIKCVPVIAPDLAAAKRYILLMSSTYGKMTNESVSDYFIDNELDFEEVSVMIDLPGVDLDLEDSMGVGSGGGLTDENDAPEPPKDPKTKMGDIYQLGPHRLMCGDSTSAEDVAKLMNGSKAAVVVTDPPYNVAVNDESEESLKARNRRSDGLKIANDKMSDEDFDGFLEEIFHRFFESMEDGAPIYVFYTDSMTIPFMTKFIGAGFHFAQNCIWAKQQFVMTRKDYHYKHEPVMYGWKPGKAHPWFTDRKQSSIWNFDRPFRNELHPTMKPIDLIEYPILNSSSHGDLVLDLFGGSGSTMIACEKTHRRCYTMELDPAYCDVVVKRWEEFTGKKAELVSQ